MGTKYRLKNILIYPLSKSLHHDGVTLPGTFVFQCEFIFVVCDLDVNPVVESRHLRVQTETSVALHKSAVEPQIWFPRTVLISQKLISACSQARVSPRLGTRGFGQTISYARKDAACLQETDYSEVDKEKQA